MNKFKSIIIFRCYLTFNVIIILATSFFVALKFESLNFYTVEAELKFNEHYQVEKFNRINREYSLSMPNIDRVWLQELARYIVQDSVFLLELAETFNLEDITSVRFKVSSTGSIAITIPTNSTQDYNNLILGIESKLNNYINANISNSFMPKVYAERNQIKSQLASYENDIDNKYSYVKEMLKKFPNASIYINNGVLLTASDALKLIEEPKFRYLLVEENKPLQHKLLLVEEIISNWSVDIKAYNLMSYKHDYNVIKFFLLLALISFVSTLVSGVFLYSYMWLKNGR